MKTITLLKPITVGDAEVSKLTFREAEAGDVIAAESMVGSNAQAVALLAAMCDTPYPAMKKLKVRDLKRIMGDAEIKELMGNDPDTTGE